MKRFFVTILSILVLYSIYYDLNYGTLPPLKKQVTAAKSNISDTLPYFEKKVQPGQTVISIVEQHINKEVPVSITHIVGDFKKLNNGVKPEDIQSGKSYRFPDYQ